jgi:hypothetical protein
MKSETQGKRLKMFIEYLISSRQIKSQKEFAVKTKNSVEKLNDYLKDKTQLQYKTISQIAGSFPELNKMWLWDGKKGMLLLGGESSFCWAGASSSKKERSFRLLAYLNRENMLDIGFPEGALYVENDGMTEEVKNFDWNETSDLFENVSVNMEWLQKGTGEIFLQSSDVGRIVEQWIDDRKKKKIQNTN